VILNDVLSTTASDGRGWRPTTKGIGTLLLHLPLPRLLQVMHFMQAAMVTFLIMTMLISGLGMRKAFLTPSSRRRVTGISEDSVVPEDGEEEEEE